MQGENFVRLKGKIIKPDLKFVGDYGSSLFKATLAIPVSDGDGNQYVKISSFKHADALGELSRGSFVEIHGHIEENVYNGKCRHCGGDGKKYWTEVVVDNFIKL